MEPIVNGLSQEYSGRMAFERRNASEEQVKRTMDRYGVRGHPGFVIAAPGGESLWIQFGPSEEEPLRRAIERFARQVARP